MRLEYARTPAPAYPPDAARRGLEGVVMLQVLVDVDGRPLEVHIHRSSGHRILDQAAARHVLRHWTFRPAVKDGVPVQAIGIVPIEFTLRSM
jgi:protein TonB